MTVFSILRYLRHGLLKFAGPLWIVLGLIYRFIIIRCGMKFAVSHSIGPYGPFHMQPEFAFSNFKDWGKKHNRAFTACVEAAKGKNCVLDVGAHIGLVTMPISKVLSPTGQVIAFEPSAANSKALKNHLVLNAISNVRVVNYLVGDKNSSTATFYESPEITGMNTCAPIKGGQNYHRQTRPQTTIDFFCKKHLLIPEIIKIDVEGFELSVLEGAASVLQTAKPTIFLSVHPKHLRALGRTSEELIKFLDRIDYLLTDISGGPVPALQLDEYIVRPRTS